MPKTHRTFNRDEVAGACRALARGAAIVMAVVVIVLMYQGELWTLQRPSTASDPSPLASCAIDVVENHADAACTRDPIH